MAALGIITYYWPPAGGPGVQRWLKLSKYLAREGVELYVVTVDPAKATYPLQDESLAADVHPSITVVRTSTTEQFGAYKKVTGKKEVPFSGFSGEDEKVSFVQKLARFVRGNFLFPDARKGWNKHAYSAAAQLINEHGVRHWITTSPPHSTQLVGLKLKKEFGIHWIADFRDPWTDIYYYDKFYPTPLVRRIERGMERRVFEACDHLISVSPSWAELYRSKGAQPAEKVVTITNGFDAEDFLGISRSRDARFTIVYAGTLAVQYPVAPFVEALNALDFPVRLRIIGRWDATSEKYLKACKSHVEVEFVSYVPKNELNAMMVSAHAMLFLLPPVASATGHIPGKLFDYLGAGNPIVGLGPVEGDAAAIIRSSGAGRVMDYEDFSGTVAYLRELHESKSPALDSERVAAYERGAQARRVMELIQGK